MSSKHVKFKDVEWIKGEDGIMGKTIMEGDKGFQIYVLKLGSNEKIPYHGHTTVKYNYILKGSMSDETGDYRVGDLAVNEKGSKHSVTAGKEGCEFLLFWDKNSEE